MILLPARRALGAGAGIDARHPHHRELLPMALAAAVIFTALLLEHENLLRLLVTDDLTGHAGAVEERLSDLDAASGRGQQDVGKGPRRAGLGRELLETD